MRGLSVALAFAAFVLAPGGATAGQQSTGAQSDLKASVKAKAPTHKRHEIIRSESGTTGAAAGHAQAR